MSKFKKNQIYLQGFVYLSCATCTVDNGNFVYVAGNVGIEYNFKQIPLLIALDYRPEFGGKGYFVNNYGSDIALGIRYKF
jgi:hypothetical protein